jgi:hypothetical protein
MAGVVGRLIFSVYDTDLCECGHFWKAHKETWLTRCRNCPRLKNKKTCIQFELVDNLTYVEILAKKRKLT